jgi:transposase
VSSKKTYRKYKKKDMEGFFYLVNEKRMSIRGAAAAEIKVSSSTAYNWHKKGLKSLELDEDIEKGGARGAVKVGRPAVLNDIHKNYLTSLVGEKSSIVLDEMMKSLTKFTDLKISKNSLHEFVTEKCRISLKRSHFHSIE